MPTYEQTFERVNFKVRPVLTEEVLVTFETSVPFEDPEFETALWASLWEQSGWTIETWPNDFSSAMTKGNTRKLAG